MDEILFTIGLGMLGFFGTRFIIKSYHIHKRQKSEIM